MKTKLTLSKKGLFSFDPDYFIYFDPKSEDYNKRKLNRNSFLCHLATCAYDYAEDEREMMEILLKIDEAFGVYVMRDVMVKLKNRDHDK